MSRAVLYSVKIGCCRQTAQFALPSVYFFLCSVRGQWTSGDLTVWGKVIRPRPFTSSAAFICIHQPISPSLLCNDILHQASNYDYITGKQVPRADKEHHCIGDKCSDAASPDRTTTIRVSKQPTGVKGRKCELQLVTDLSFLIPSIDMGLAVIQWWTYHLMF